MTPAPAEPQEAAAALFVVVTPFAEQVSVDLDRKGWLATL